MTKRPQQIKTIDVMIQEVMRSKAFRRGVADVRAGRKPRFDEQTEGDDLHYERGRQFAVLTPRKMPIVLPQTKQLNPKAVNLFEKYFFLRDIR
jgi:hypothetical protein